MNSSALMTRTRIVDRRLTLLCGVSVAMLVMFMPEDAGAIDASDLPSGGQVISGQVGFDYTTLLELHITQQTDLGIINWDSFNIGSNALTQFHHPSSSALTVNRVLGDGDPTQILGRLYANGRIIVLDRNGVIFGKDSQVDVGGIIVSTGDVIDIASDLSHVAIGDVAKDGFIVNEGSISVAEAGLAAFVAPTVINNGIIEARLGRIEIGAGSSATIDLYGDGLIELALDDSTEQTIINAGILQADGGNIRIQAAAARDIVDNVINNTGMIVADSVGQDKTGKILLLAGGANKSDAAGQGATINNGYISAAGNEAGQKGGTIDLLGDMVVLSHNSLIDTSGDAGGGNIRIGGDYLGTGDVRTARYTYVAGSAMIFNDALTKGDGGRTIVWSDETTDFHGNIFARGGTQGGNGGFVETSGKINLLADGYVDLTAPNGSKGTYLLDPADITIYGNFAPTDITGLQLWLDAQQLSLNNGDSVSTWENLAPVNADATGVTDLPQYSSAAFGGRGGVSFGTSELLTTGSFPVRSIFTVARSNNAVFGNYEGILGGDIANPGNGHILNGWAGATNLYAGATSTFYSARQNGQSTPNGLFSNINAASGWVGSFVGSSALTNAQTWIGRISGGARSWNGQIGEIIAYSTEITGNDRNLLEQYQSAKWGIALDPLAGAGTEAAEAMHTTNGYGAFTTRYLERLSNTADIVLQATNSITLDFKGDTLNLANDRSISLTTSTGDIRTASTGSIITNRTGAGGNITFTAGDDIAFNHAFTMNAQNGGQITLNASDSIGSAAGLTITNGTLNASSQIITGTYTGKSAIMDSNTGTINATVSFDALDVRGAGAILQAGYIGTPGAPSQAMANLIKIDGAAGTGNADYKFSGFNIGYVAPAANTETIDKIAKVVQQTPVASSTGAGGDDSEEDLSKATAAESHTMGSASYSADCLVSLENVGCVVQ